MRGDSVRDFYAKTLAVVGLSALAGAGAIVDYWPTASTLPVPLPAFEVVAGVGALPVPGVSVALASAPQPARASVSSATAPTPIEPVLNAQRIAMISASSGEGAMFEVVVPVRHDMVPALGQAVFLTEPSLGVDSISASGAETELAPVSSRASSGFLRGAVKKTARTGAKTGTSILGAFRAVGGAMRRALPL